MLRMKTLIKLKLRPPAILQEIQNFSGKRIHSRQLSFAIYIGIVYLGSLSFCLENTEDVENLRMSRKEVC